MTTTSILWFRDMATNNAWANERLYAACGALTKEELAAPRTSFFPSITKTLAHIAIVDDYYVDGLTGGGRGRAVFEGEPELEASFDKTRALQQAMDARLCAYVDAADDAELARLVRLERRDGPQEDRAGDILLHLVLHQVHHRGQVHAMLSGTRIAPPQLDDFFLRGDRPTALAELAKARAARA
jgi:uncharacterized damage-inducible protein DinB